MSQQIWQPELACLELKNPAKFLHESGLLFDINRKVLHPHGLALWIEQNDDGSFLPGCRLDATPNGEAFAFAPERAVLAEKRLAKFVADPKSAIARACAIDAALPAVTP